MEICSVVSFCYWFLVFMDKVGVRDWGFIMVVVFEGVNEKTLRLNHCLGYLEWDSNFKEKSWVLGEKTNYETSTVPPNASIIATLALCYH